MGTNINTNNWERSTAELVLLTEITVFCSDCLSEHSPIIMDMEVINRKVLKLQSLDNFELRGVCISSSSDSSSPKHSDKSAFNPFCQEVEDNCVGDTDTDRFECPVCSKDFSRSDFLDFHKKIFHKIDKSVSESAMESEELHTKVVAPNFVDDKDADLMKTFCKDVMSDSDSENGVSAEVVDSIHDPNLDLVDKTFTEARCPRGVRKVLKYPK